MTSKNHYPDLTKKLPEEVKIIFRIFLAKKHDSIRLVGGCVRDLLFLKPIKDYDFACQFRPHEIIEILEENNIKAIPTGIKFGTITAIINHKHFEITTLRKDNENDGRHCEPEFVDDYLQDASRRDFTINALYMNDYGLISDYFDGINDIIHRKVRFVGNANQRINEDYLRILRFFRFSARYAAMLDLEGFKACIENKQGIKKLSSDRVRNEIFSIINSAANDRLLWILSEIEESKIREEIFSTKFNLHNLANLLDVEEALKIKVSTHLKFAALTIDATTNLAEINLRMNFSNSEKKYFQFLNQNALNLDFKALRRLLVFEDKNLIRDFYLLNLSKISDVNLGEAQQLLDYIDNFSVAKFPLNGDDLIEKGIENKRIGDMLLSAKNAWIESDFSLNKEQLLRFLENN